MADMLSIGSSALLAYQRALSTISNNVANANTPGYSRELVGFQERSSVRTGAGSTGAGVNAISVTRAQDPFLTSQLWAATSSSAAAAVVADAATRIDKQFSSADLNLSTPLDRVFDALDAWAAAPTDVASRQAVLQSAQTLSSRWAATDQQLQQLHAGLIQQAGAAATQVNTLTQQIARYNDAIAVATGQSGGNPPNDLLDRRDRAVNQLAAQIGVNVVTNPRGDMNVYTSSGQALVLGTHATSVSLTSTGDDGTLQLQLQLQLGSGSSAIRLNDVDGGALGGAFSALQETVAPAQRKLAGLANRLAESVNRVQAAGTDANGNPGQALFAVASPTVQAAASNTGSVTASAAITDAVHWPAEPVVFKYDGTSWSAVGAISGRSYPIFGSGTTSDPLTAAGLSITLNGSPAAGDRFNVDDIGSGLSMALTRPDQLAAANPVTPAPAAGNSGSAVVGRLQVTDPGNAQLRTPASLQFVSPTQVSINGAAAVAFTGTIASNGWSLTLDGTPAAGDTFTLSPTGANSADNGVANLLAGLRTQAGADGQSVVQAQAALVAGVGSDTARVQGANQAQQALLSQAKDARDQVSGVSLNEEAADLVRFQQAYQAAAQIISSSQTLFNSLLHAAGGV